MGKIFQKPEALSDVITHYCPGCTHGVIHRLIAEVIDELGILGKTVGIAPVGCAVLAYNYFTFDFQEASHGRAPAMATGLKRVRPDLVVFTYQGDGDLASIGMAEIIHAANRGEKFTTIFVNNAVYGMTGGQMAPTTMPNQRTTTSPLGRNVEEVGWPIKMAELLAALETPAYIIRQLEKFAPMVRSNGLILINSSLISIHSKRIDVLQLRIPVNDLALKLGNMRTANIIALSALVCKTNIVSNQSLTACVKSEFANKPKMIPLNVAAIKVGQEAVMAHAVPT